MMARQRGNLPPDIYGRVWNQYRAVFTYSVEGVQYVRRSPRAASVPEFSVGDSVTVFYDRSSPKRFYVLEEGRSTVEYLIFIAVGAVMMIIASVALVKP